MLEQNISIIKSADKFQEELSGEEISSFYKDYVHKMFPKMVKESYVVNVKNVTDFDKAILQINKNIQNHLTQSF